MSKTFKAAGLILISAVILIVLGLIAHYVLDITLPKGVYTFENTLHLCETSGYRQAYFVNKEPLRYDALRFYYRLSAIESDGSTAELIFVTPFVLVPAAQEQAMFPKKWRPVDSLEYVILVISILAASAMIIEIVFEDKEDSQVSPEQPTKEENAA